MLNRDQTDDDDDLLADDYEDDIGTDPCLADTDGDGVSDGYEYQSASDLNDDEHQEPNDSLPYPGKRPYPNALDPSTRTRTTTATRSASREESSLWLYTIRKYRSPPHAERAELLRRRAVHGQQPRLRRPTPSGAPRRGHDRHQQFLTWAGLNGYDRVDCGTASVTGGTSPVTRSTSATSTARVSVSTTRAGDYANSELRYYDASEDGWLTDAERDEDADGLTNFDESHGCMLGHNYWTSLYDKETPYSVSSTPAPSSTTRTRTATACATAPTTQDHDDLPNMMECGRNAASGRPYAEDDEDPPSTPLKGFVNPFNPCLPAVLSRTCNRNPSLEAAWAPFNADDTYYLVKN